MIKCCLLWDPLTLRALRCTEKHLNSRYTKHNETNDKHGSMDDTTFIADRLCVDMHRMSSRRRGRRGRIHFPCRSAKRIVIHSRSSNSFLCKWTVACIHCSFYAFTWHTKNENEKHTQFRCTWIVDETKWNEMKKKMRSPAHSINDRLEEMIIKHSNKIESKSNLTIVRDAKATTSTITALAASHLHLSLLDVQWCVCLSLFSTKKAICSHISDSNLIITKWQQILLFFKRLERRERVREKNAFNASTCARTATIRSMSSERLALCVRATAEWNRIMWRTIDTVHHFARTLSSGFAECADELELDRR